MSSCHAANRRFELYVHQPLRPQPMYRREPEGEIISRVILRDGKIVVEPVPPEPPEKKKK